MSTSSNQRFGTRAVHAGQQPDPGSGAIMTPIYQTSTYVQDAPGKHKGHEYARVTNPTRSALEGNLASLENARYGVCFASGVAGIDAIMKGLDPGDHVVATEDLYGGTYRLFVETFERFGLSFSFVDMSDPRAVEGALTGATKMMWIETPTNPLLRVYDISALAEMAHANDIDVAVDNTFASPYLQRPLDLGADLVLHSTTKYLGGHSDVVGGAVCLNDEDWHERLRFQVKSAGAVPGPQDCFLVLRGTKTLHVRMKEHCKNAQMVAEMLDEHSAVDRVFYPGLASHTGHDLAREQMDGFGGMMSFSMADDRTESAQRILSNTQVFSLAESLGGVESLIGHPASMTHASIPPEKRQRIGITDSLIRLSVGIEDGSDLVEDLAKALDRA